MRRTYYSGGYKRSFDIGRGRTATFSQWGDRETKAGAEKVKKELQKEGYYVRLEPIRRYGRIAYYIIYIKPKRR